MPRPFMETLRELRSGRTLEDLAEELAAVVQAVRNTGKAGELTLKLKIKPPGKGGATYLTIEDSVSTKLPKLDHADSVFFFTKDGGLSRHDPEQGELQFRAVATSTGHVEQVDTLTGEITGRTA